MPLELAQYITQYGYLAIFVLVFLQELGVPNPVPNELVLLFSGYLASIHTLSFTLVFLTVVAADAIGTIILFLVFYYFGEQFFKHKPRWIPLSRERLARIEGHISKRGVWSIYVGRLIPYVRGYTSVAAGLLHIRPRVFIPAVIISAITWSGGYVIAGMLLGPYWQKAANTIGGVWLMLIVFAGIGLFFAIRAFVKYVVYKKKNIH